MTSSKNAVSIRKMCVAALLCAVAILIPMVSPIKIQIPPMSFTLGSHIANFFSMYLSPGIALALELGATLGFFLAGFPPVVVLRALSQVVFVALGAYMLTKKPSILDRASGVLWFGVATGVLHGVMEAVVVTAFWFSGMTMEGTFVSTVLGLVGVGTLVHSLVDYYLALLVWRPVSRAAKLTVGAFGAPRDS